MCVFVGISYRYICRAATTVCVHNFASFYIMVYFINRENPCLFTLHVSFDFVNVEVLLSHNYMDKKGKRQGTDYLEKLTKVIFGYLEEAS